MTSLQRPGYADELPTPPESFAAKLSSTAPPVGADRKNNMNNDNMDNNNNDHGVWPTVELTEMKRQLDEQRRANEDYRSDVRYNVERIAGVLHEYARDCGDVELVDELIDEINQATRNGFPEIGKCTRTFELTLTYVVEVQAFSEEDARDRFDEGECDHLIVPSDYYELDVEEGC